MEEEVVAMEEVVSHGEEEEKRAEDDKMIPSFSDILAFLKVPLLLLLLLSISPLLQLQPDNEEIQKLIKEKTSAQPK